MDEPTKLTETIAPTHEQQLIDCYLSAYIAGGEDEIVFRFTLPQGMTPARQLELDYATALGIYHRMQKQIPISAHRLVSLVWSAMNSDEKDC